MIWDRLNVAGGELNLALALADKGNDKGESIFPGVDLLCRQTRQSRATVQRQLAHFRDVDWLQVVQEGGLAGGRGMPTIYRINPLWISGGSLEKLPDIRPTEEISKGPQNEALSLPKGPHSSEAVSGAKGPHPEQERASNGPVKGLTAMRPDPKNPSLTSERDARAIPSGSRAAQEPPKPDYQFAERINHWRRIAGGHVLAECRAFGITAGIVRSWQDLPENVQQRMAPKLEAVITATVERERPPSRFKHQQIQEMLEREITDELKQFVPPPPARRAAVIAGEA